MTSRLPAFLRRYGQLLADIVGLGPMLYDPSRALLHSGETENGLLAPHALAHANSFQGLAVDHRGKAAAVFLQGFAVENTTGENGPGQIKPVVKAMTATDIELMINMGVEDMFSRSELKAALHQLEEYGPGLGQRLTEARNQAGPNSQVGRIPESPIRQALARSKAASNRQRRRLTIIIN